MLGMLGSDRRGSRLSNLVRVRALKFRQGRITNWMIANAGGNGGSVMTPFVSRLSGPVVVVVGGDGDDYGGSPW